MSTTNTTREIVTMETCSGCSGHGVVAKTKRVARTKISLPCLCGCDADAKAGSRFIPGHDSRVKGFLGKAKRYRDATEEDRKKLATVRFPRVLVDRANSDANLVVAGYNAAEILALSEIAGVAEGE